MKNVLGRLKKFWSLSKKSSLIKIKIHAICASQFPVQNLTKKDKIPAICDEFNLQKIKSKEWFLLEEYVMLLKPITHFTEILFCLKNKNSNFTNLSIWKT